MAIRPHYKFWICWLPKTKIHGLWLFPWKQSVWQNLDQDRSSRNVLIYLKTTLPYKMHFLLSMYIKEFVNSTSPIIYLVCPPKFCITFVSHFSWISQSSQEKLKTMLMQNFAGRQGALWGMWNGEWRMTSFWVIFHSLKLVLAKWFVVELTCVENNCKK